MTKTTAIRLHRRAWLSNAGAFVAGLAWWSTGCGGQDAHVCAEPETLSRGDSNVRASVHYTEASSDNDRRCANCAMFEIEPNQTCGTCQFVPGAVNPAGLCDSWSEPI